MINPRVVETPNHAAVKRYRLKNLAICNQRSREWGWKKYGIVNSDGTPFTQANYDRLYLLQQEKCAICEKPQNELRERLSADHNHDTGVIRGLLCPACNARLAHKENKRFIQLDKDYLNGY